MPDISMCKNQTCPSKTFCYRFTAIPNDFYQSYGVFKVKEKEKKCEHYIQVFQVIK